MQAPKLLYIKISYLIPRLVESLGLVALRCSLGFWNMHTGVIQRSCLRFFRAGDTHPELKRTNRNLPCQQPKDAGFRPVEHQNFRSTA